MKRCGMILGTENDLLVNTSLDSVDIFYSLSVKKHGTSIYSVYGVCWIDSSMSIPFAFEYDKSTDNVEFTSEFRLCFCSYESYNKYYLNIRYTNNANTANFLCIPWLKFHDGVIGVAIPQLIENILVHIPNVIVF